MPLACRNSVYFVLSARQTGGLRCGCVPNLIAEGISANRYSQAGPQSLFFLNLGQF